MKFEIYSYKGFDQIEFGFSREEVRKLIDDEVNSFYRTQTSKVATDSFDNLGIFANYDESYHCEAIEFSHPAEPFYFKKDLFAIPYKDLLNWFYEMDNDIEEFDVGFTSYKLGIGFYAPEKEENPNLPCEGVIIFKEGYYDD